MSDHHEDQELARAGNAVAITDLERRFRRLTSWLYLFLALIPSGLLVFGLMFVVGVLTTAGPILALAGILLFVVGLGGAILMAGDRSARGRSLAVAQQANALGFLYLEKPEASAYAALSELQFFRRADTTVAQNLLAGLLEDVAVLSLDCTVLFKFIGIGQQKMAGFNQTVILLPDGAAPLPEFALYPKGLFEQFSQYLEDLRIEVPDQPDLMTSYGVRGAEPDRVTACLTPEVAELCLAGKNLTVVVRDRVVAVFRQDKRIPPPELPQRFAEAARLARALWAGADRADRASGT